MYSIKFELTRKDKYYAVRSFLSKVCEQMVGCNSVDVEEEENEDIYEFKPAQFNYNALRFSLGGKALRYIFLIR